MTKSEYITAIKDFFSILAAICVGVWAIYSSVVKNEERKADLEIIELEQKTNISPHLSTSIIIEQVTSLDKNRVYAVYVALKNTGDEDVRVYLDKESLLVAEVEIQDNGVRFNNVTQLGESRFIGRSKVVGPFLDIGANESYDIAYISAVNEPGIYLFRFLAKVSSPAIDKKKILNFGESSFVYYSAGTDRFLSVE